MTATRKLPSPQTQEAASAASNDWVQLVERIARDPSIDVDKLDRLLQMRERENARLSEQAFSAALATAQSEMTAVVADAPIYKRALGTLPTPLWTGLYGPYSPGTALHCRSTVRRPALTRCG